MQQRFLTAVSRTLVGFAAMTAAVALAASAARASAGSDVRPRTKLPAAAKAARPAPAQLKDGVPIGLYFMTRFWPSNGTLEKVVWYFAPDGTAYEELEHGFSPEDLAAHKGRKGSCRADGNNLVITWADGKPTSSRVEPSQSGRAFTWNMGIFTAVQAFGDPTEVAGVYEGGESLSGGGNRAALSKRLELRPDGTFRWSGVSFVGTTTQSSQMSVGQVDAGSTGTWRLSDYSLLLSDSNGNVYRRIAFPYDDSKTPLKPDRIFFGGLMYKKQG